MSAILVGLVQIRLVHSKTGHKENRIELDEVSGRPRERDARVVSQS